MFYLSDLLFHVIEFG
ncbi:hypothetical protein ACTFQF_04830 [Aliivibrio fischeri]